MDTGCVELLLRDGRKISIDKNAARLRNGTQAGGVLHYRL